MAIQELLMLSKDYYLDRAPKEIEQNRKDTFFITLTHTDKPWMMLRFHFG